MFGMPNDVKFVRNVSFLIKGLTQQLNSWLKIQQKTGIKINDKFVCSACKYNDEKNIIDWKERKRIN